MLRTARPPLWHTTVQQTSVQLRPLLHGFPTHKTRVVPHDLQIARRGRTRPDAPPASTSARSMPYHQGASTPPHPGTRHCSWPAFSWASTTRITWLTVGTGASKHHARPSRPPLAQRRREGRLAYFDMPTLSPGTSTPQDPAVIPAPSDATAPLRAHP